MLIGIDGNEANVKNRVGSNVYAYQLLWQMYNQNSRVKYKIYLKDKPLDDLPKETEYWQYKVLKPKFLWTQWRLPMELYLTSEKPDLFFTPGHYAPRFCPSPTVISIMDLAFLRYPEQFKKSDRYQLVNWTKYSIQKASHIFTISQFTKKEIIHFYKYPRDKITVTYPGVENIKYQGSKCKYKNYFLYIGTLQPRKNIIRLIEAFKTLNNKLVIVGKKGWLYDDIFNKVKELGLEDKVIFTGFVDEQEKIALLQNAIAFVLPSLYEGFGIPVLEAMQAGCPVIISDNSSLPEVGNNAAFYIRDPYDVGSIEEQLLKMIKLSQSQRKLLVSEGLKQVKKFSWQETASKTLLILEEVLKKNENNR